MQFKKRLCTLITLLIFTCSVSGCATTSNHHDGNNSNQESGSITKKVATIGGITILAGVAIVGLVALAASHSKGGMVEDIVNNQRRGV